MKERDLMGRVRGLLLKLCVALGSKEKEKNILGAKPFGNATSMLYQLNYESTGSCIVNQFEGFIWQMN